MKLVETDIADVKILEPRVFGDERGFFMETWNARTLAGLGLDVAFVQDNESLSAKGVLRGLHYQIRNPQGKLVRVVTGSVFDVAVDMRKSSASFGRWVGVHLSAANKRMFWIPPGFAHGFLCLEDATHFLYKCTDYYAPEHERSLLWNDPAIGIHWPLDCVGQPQLTPKDQQGRLLRDAEAFP